MGGLLLLVLTLSGCAQLQPLSVRGIDSDAVLDLMVRLGQADEAELVRMGASLQGRSEGPGRRLRIALWKSTPGHEGFAPESARGELARMLDDEAALGRRGHQLVRAYLAQLDRRIELLQANRDLSFANRELQDQIKALTDLEQTMGEDDDNGE